MDIIGEDKPIIDGGMGTCMELRRRLDDAELISMSKEDGDIKIYNSMESIEAIEICNRLLFS